jgi:hypothetical protein
MARYVVSALKAVATPAGTVLDRIVGPGWMATPSSLLDLMADGQHEFVLDGSSHSLAARRDPAGNVAILVVDDQGREVAPSSLPHWQMEIHRGSQVKTQNWWQRLLDPDAR